MSDAFRPIGNYIWLMRNHVHIVTPLPINVKNIFTRGLFSFKLFQPSMCPYHCVPEWVKEFARDNLTTHLNCDSHTDKSHQYKMGGLTCVTQIWKIISRNIFVGVLLTSISRLEGWVSGRQKRRGIAAESSMIYICILSRIICDRFHHALFLLW